MKDPFKRRFAAGLLICSLLLLVWAIVPFISGVLGAIILYVISIPLYRWMVKHLHMGSTIPALILIVVSLVIILLPLSILITLLAFEAGELMGTLDRINELMALSPIQLTEGENIIEQSTFAILRTIQRTIFESLGNILRILISVILMYFLFFFMLINNKDLERIIHEHLPFNDKNSSLLIDELYRITNTTLIGNGLVAILQGILMGIGFWAIGVNGPVLWGFVTAIVAILPFIGPAVVWGPGSLILLALGDVSGAITLLIWGFVVSQIDHLLRPLIQRKLGNIHPLISLVGILIGIPFFGIVGIVFGPLLVAYSLLLARIYKEEYLSGM